MVGTTTGIARPSRRPLSRIVAPAGLALLAWAGGPARAADGADFSGMWQSAAPRASILPNDRALPFTAKGKQQYDANVLRRAKKDYAFDLMTSRCSTPGMPRAMLTPGRLRVFQDPRVMTLGFEWNRIRRVIAMPALPPQISLFNAAEEAKLVGTKMGTSTARWDGATLVVTTKDLATSTLLDDAVPHSFGLRVTERLSLKDADTLEDRITMEDPEIFTKPVETVLTYKRRPDAILPEDVCLDRKFGAPALPTK